MKSRRIRSEDELIQRAITEFAKRLDRIAKKRGLPTHDRGPFNSNWCGKLEDTITEMLTVAGENK